MELPQSRSFEAQGRKKPTHDFLSACSNNSTVQPDPMPSSQGEYLKTHDFLQPLERVGTRSACAKEGIDSTAKSALVLPGGIRHIPYLYHNQRVPKSEVPQMFTVSQASSNESNAKEENSIPNCSSYAASGFTLWDESVEKKEHTSKKSARERTNIRADAAATMGQWQGMEQRSSYVKTFGLKIQSQSFMDMIRSAKGSSQEDDMDDDDEEFVMKKDNNTSTSQCQRVDLRVKVDGKGQGNEQKPNTPRSKHSATEQRRRSKINDRFQMLRKLIPNSDQKRNKASFLLEYIHFLQEKVKKHELVPYQGKLTNLRSHQQTLETVLTDAQAVDMDQQCLNRVMETSPFPVLGQGNSFFTPAISQLCPVSSDAAMETGELRKEKEEEELSVHKGTINISTVYSQGMKKFIGGLDFGRKVGMATTTITTKITTYRHGNRKKLKKDNSVKNI